MNPNNRVVLCRIFSLRGSKSSKHAAPSPGVGQAGIISEVDSSAEHVSDVDTTAVHFRCKQDKTVAPTLFIWQPGPHQLLLDALDGHSKHGSALNDALYHRHFVLADVLLNYGADPRKASSENGSNALHFAVQAGNLALVLCLLNLGMSIHQLNNAGQWAGHFSTPEFLGTMRKAGILLYGSALNDAINFGDREETLRLLTVDAVDLFVRLPNYGLLCTHFAAARDWDDILLLLVERGVSVNARCFANKTLDSYCANGAIRSRVVELRKQEQRRKALVVLFGSDASHWPLSRYLLHLVLGFWNGD